MLGGDLLEVRDCSLSHNEGNLYGTTLYMFELTDVSVLDLANNTFYSTDDDNYIWAMMADSIDVHNPCGDDSFTCSSSVSTVVIHPDNIKFPGSNTLCECNGVDDDDTAAVDDDDDSDDTLQADDGSSGSDDDVASGPHSNRFPHRSS